MNELPYDEDNWVGGNVGGVVEVSDYFLDFDDIRYCVDNKVAWDELTEWYDYCLTLREMFTHAAPTPTIGAWHDGCPRFTKEELRKFKSII